MACPYENLEALYSEFASATDRAAAIVGGAFLDEVVASILSDYLVKASKLQEKLFSGHGPLSTFSGKIDMCYALGLISEREHRWLHTIRKVRNAFAHDHRLTTFKAQQIADFCKALRLPNELVPPERMPMVAENGELPPPVVYIASPNSPRGVFEDAVRALVNILGTRGSQALTTHCNSPPDFDTAAAAAELQLQIMVRLDSELKSLASNLEGSELIDGASERLHSVLHDRTEAFSTSGRVYAEQLRRAVYKVRDDG